MRQLSLLAMLFFVCGIANANENLPIDNAEAATADSSTVYLNRNLDEVVATGVRYTTDIRHLPQTLTLVNHLQLTENQRTSVLPTLMEQVPGLMVTSRGVMGYGVSGGGSGGMMLRGISSGIGQVMVLIDGHPQYQGIYGHSIADSYLSLTTERVEVLRGPASLLYGSNAMGGVINIVTRALPQDGVQTDISLGGGSYGTFQGEVTNRLRHNKFSSTIAAQYSRSDNHRPHMGFEQYGGLLKLGVDFTSNWNSFANIDITHFNASQPGTESAPLLEADQWITRGSASIGIENHYDKTSGRLSFYNNFGRHKINDGYNPKTGQPQTRYFRSKDALLGVSWYQSAQFWTGSRLTLGVDYQHIYGRAYFTDRETGDVLETQYKQSGHEHNNETAGYIDYTQDLVDILTFNAGLRYDHHSVAGGEWIPQVGLVARFTDASEAKISASKGFRNPTMRELYLYPPSNEDLDPERLWNYELSWKQRLIDNRLHYAINLFIIDGDNVIQTVAGEGGAKNINTGEIKNRGAEFELSYQISDHWFVNTNHSWLHMKYHVVAAPEYKGYLGAKFKSNRWAVNLGLQQVHDLFTSVGDEDTTEDFTLVNATVDYNLIKGLHLWLKGDNLLGQHYEINAGYPMPKATFMAGLNYSF